MYQGLPAKEKHVGKVMLRLENIYKQMVKKRIVQNP